MFSYLGILFMRFLAKLPLSWVRGFAALIGRVLFVLAAPRRRVVEKNLLLCFPERTAKERRALARESFIYFCQAWLDRSWLWHAPRSVLEKRLKLHGEVMVIDWCRERLFFFVYF